MQVRQVPFASELYHQLCDLRNRELRLPLGLVLNSKDLEGEEEQIHFGIFEDNHPIACMILVPQDDDKLKMRQVCVAKANQGSGLGKNLLLAAEAFAKEQGFSQLYCHARETAYNFYRNSGYIQLGEKFEEVGIPHYFMLKSLRVS